MLFKDSYALWGLLALWGLVVMVVAIMSPFKSLRTGEVIYNFGFWTFVLSAILFIVTFGLMLADRIFG